MTEKKNPRGTVFEGGAVGRRPRGGSASSMTMLDFFAGLAMAAAVVENGLPATGDDETIIAESAYSLALAMLAEAERL